MNKLYLIQPQASQINVRHVGSSTYGNHDQLLRSEEFRKLTKFTDEKIHVKLFLTGPRAFLLEVARIVLDYAVNSRPLPSKILEKIPFSDFFLREGGGCTQASS